MSDVLLTIEQAAEVLAISETALRHRIRRGQVPTVRLSDRTLRVRREDLDELTRSTTPAIGGVRAPTHHQSEPTTTRKPETETERLEAQFRREERRRREREE